MKIRSQHCFDILLGTLTENVNSLGIDKIVSIIRKMLWYEELWEKLSTVFCKNVSILLLFPHKLCIKSPFRIYVEVYSNLLQTSDVYWITFKFKQIKNLTIECKIQKRLSSNPLTFAGRVIKFFIRCFLNIGIHT